MSHPLNILRRHWVELDGLWVPADSVNAFGHGHGHGLGSRAVWTPEKWYGTIVEADWDAAHVTLTSGAVSTWQDRTGAHHAAQGTAGNRPTMAAVGFNGKPSVRFVPTSAHFLTLSTVIAGLTAAHLFAVWKIATHAGLANQDAVFTLGAALATFYPLSSDAGVYESFGTSVRLNGIARGGRDLTVDHCYEVVSTAAKLNTFRNGTAWGARASNTVGWAATQHIGKSEAASYANMWIARLIVCKQELTGADLTQMRAYLTATYGIVF